MADWLQLSPGETVICRSRQTAKSASVLAIIASLVIAITWPMGEALVAFFLDDIDRLLTLGHFVGSLVRALVVAVLVFSFAYKEEYVVTDHRVINRHGPMLRVFRKNSELQIGDVAEIKGRTKAKYSSFKLVSTDGGSLTVSFVPDLDGIHRALVRLTGLPDPVPG